MQSSAGLLTFKPEVPSEVAMTTAYHDQEPDDADAETLVMGDVSPTADESASSIGTSAALASMAIPEDKIYESIGDLLKRYLPKNFALSI